VFAKKSDGHRFQIHHKVDHQPIIKNKLACSFLL
jgi:hypothetical protein